MGLSTQERYRMRQGAYQIAYSAEAEERFVLVGLSVQNRLMVVPTYGTG